MSVGATEKCLMYIHGKGGSALEAEHYRMLFPEYTVIGLEYYSTTPWEAGEEIARTFRDLDEKYDEIVLVANSIGAFFAMNAQIADCVQRAFFISPIVDMVGLIEGVMAQANITESELEARSTIPVSPDFILSWEYLVYVREHPICWSVPTEILYGQHDALTSYETMSAFSERHGAKLTVMSNGEHWFHTEEQMSFLDAWLTGALRG